MDELIKDFLEENDNELYKAVVEDVIDSTDPDEIETYLKDIVECGCSSGCVSSMIYYDDTVKFYDTYADFINGMLAVDLGDTGLSIDKFFRNFDNSDPLIREVINKNMLAWYAYESVCRDLLIYINNYE